MWDYTYARKKNNYSVELGFVRFDIHFDFRRETAFLHLKPSDTALVAYPTNEVNTQIPWLIQNFVSDKTKQVPKLNLLIWLNK